VYTAAAAREKPQFGDRLVTLTSSEKKTKKKKTLTFATENEKDQTSESVMTSKVNFSPFQFLPSGDDSPIT
jgi:hypothetical protein